MRSAILTVLLMLGSAAVTSAEAPPLPGKPNVEPGWMGVIIARGELKEKIESTPILERPYRPLHVYGNTVRRNYYRGVAAPSIRDLVQGTGSLVTNR